MLSFGFPVHGHFLWDPVEAVRRRTECLHLFPFIPWKHTGEEPSYLGAVLTLHFSDGFRGDEILKTLIQGQRPPLGMETVPYDHSTSSLYSYICYSHPLPTEETVWVRKGFQMSRTAQDSTTQR